MSDHKRDIDVRGANGALATSRCTGTPAQSSGHSGHFSQCVNYLHIHCVPNIRQLEDKYLADINVLISVLLL